MCVDECVYLLPGQEYPTSAQCMTNLETYGGSQVAEHHSVARGCPQSNSMGPCIFVLKDGILAHLTEIWYNMMSENFVNVRWPFKFPGTTRAVHTSTIVCRGWLDSRF